MTPIALVGGSRPHGGRIDPGNSTLHEGLRHDESPEPRPPVSFTAVRIERPQPGGGLHRKPGSDRRRPGHEARLVLILAHCMFCRLTRQHQCSLRISGLVQLPRDEGQLPCGRRVALERCPCPVPVRAHRITTIDEDRAQTLMDQRGLGSAGRRPHPDRESGVDETHAAGMQGQVIADGGSGDLDAVRPSNSRSGPNESSKQTASARRS